MRIGYDLRPAQGPSAERGIGRYTRSLLRAMAQEAGASIEWTLIAWPNRPLPDGMPPGAHVVHVADASQPLVSLLRRTAKKGPAMLLHRALDRRALGQTARRAHLDALLLPALFEREFFGAERLCCPTVKVCHDLGPHFSGEAYGMGGTYARMYRQELEALARADAVIAISEAAKKDIIAVGQADPAKVRVIYQGVDPVFRPAGANEIAAARQQFEIEGPFFLASGGLSENKNLGAVVGALAALRRRGRQAERLLVLGAPPDQFHPGRAQIIRRMEELGLRPGEDVVFLPRVSDKQMVALYGASVALVFPSLFEGFGLPPAECMACGAPVIVSNTTSLPEVVGDAGMLVAPEDVGAIADAMTHLCDDLEFRARQITCGLAQAARFSWPQTAKETISLLSKL